MSMEECKLSSCARLQKKMEMLQVLEVLLHPVIVCEQGFPAVSITVRIVVLHRHVYVCARVSVTEFHHADCRVRLLVG